ncbi:hypothetical protein GH714_019993 [Hevea brasiliensis]|uniref:Retrotransposon gag domain-containing protein n=1 Tax=Hevea brasiliensis TaxID=3981 RepID=A0A6A6M3U9_HEVBR|nr:hypothetical protein GH714_019993 [Hevea brasiliensis]
MERKALVLCVVVGFLGLLSAATDDINGVGSIYNWGMSNSYKIAYCISNMLSFLTSLVIFQGFEIQFTSATQCTFPRSSALALGLTSAVALMMAQVILNVATIGVVEMYISGKDKLGYINGDLPQPPETDPSFRKWRTENAIVKGWIINSMEPSLVGNFIRFSTAKQVWDSIATTYFYGFDSSQVYDLRRRVSRMQQGGGFIEKYCNDLQGLWREIDFRRPNPMECATDIQKYNSLLQEERVYIFLDGLDDRLDNIRSHVLQLKPFPTIEQAYAYVRREYSPNCDGIEYGECL